MRWIAISLTAACVGCTSTSMTAPIMDTWESMKRRPNRVIVSVAPNYLEKDGFPYHQGMYVRAHFFLNDEPVTMPAEGEMTFVAYDKSKSDPTNGTNPTPVGIYRITADEMAKHLRKDIIGDSYIFWLPYEPAGPTQMVVNANFRPKYGESFTAEPSVVHLTPLKSSVAAANTEEKRRPRPNYVAFDSLAPKKTVNVQTIALNNKPATTQLETIGGAMPVSAAAVQKQSLQASDTSKQPPPPPRAN